MRLVVDRQGSDPEGRLAGVLRTSVAGGCRGLRRARDEDRAPSGPLAVRRHALEPRALGHIDHRKVVVVDGRIGWVGGAGIEDHFEDGRFHDLFIRVTGPVVAQLQLVFVASFAGSAARFRRPSSTPSSRRSRTAPSGTAVVLHNAPVGTGRSPTRSRHILDGARETLDVVNPYVTDRGMIRRIEKAARRGVRVRLFVPANANNWACAARSRFHHAALLDAGVRILEYPTMLHAKAFVRDGEEVLAGTCNLEAWSLKRFFEIDMHVRSRPSRRSSRSGSRRPPKSCRRPVGHW